METVPHARGVDGRYARTPASCGRTKQVRFGSLSYNDNVEYVVINNPRPATYRLKAYSYNVPLSVRLKVGIAAVVVRGGTSPTLSVTTSPSAPAPRVGSTFDITTTVSPSSRVADAVRQYVASVPSGLELVRLSTPRPDGVTMDFPAGAGVVLGAIPTSGSRRAVWTFRAVLPGVKTISFVTTSRNSPTRRVNATVNVGGGNITFTDQIVPGVTQIRALHFSELRQRIDEARRTYGLGAFNWTGGTGRASGVRAVHITEMRNALNQAYDMARRQRGRHTPIPWCARGGPPSEQGTSRNCVARSSRCCSRERDPTSARGRWSCGRNRVDRVRFAGPVATSARR